METVSPSKLVKANKEHKCDFCNLAIAKNEKYLTQVNKFDGNIYRWKSHTNCMNLADKLKLFDCSDEGLTQDDFKDCINDYYNDLEIEGKDNVTFEDKLKKLIEVHLCPTT